MRRFLTPRILLLAAGHFTVDTYSSFFAPLLPLMMTRLHMNLTRVGALVAIASISSSFAQPLYGWLSDRLRRPWFVALGPIVAAVFISAVGRAPSYEALVALLVLGGMGVAAFHPQAAVLAGDGTKHRALAMSFFVSGGTLGFSLGPLIAVSVVGMAGIENTWIAIFPGLAMGAVLLAWSLRMPPSTRHAGPRPALAELRPVLRPLTLLYFAVVCRSAVSYGFMTFLPIYLHRQGFSVGAGGRLLTLYLAMGAFGSFLGGWLAHHWGGRRVVIASFVGATPLFFAFLVLPTVPGLISLIAGAFVLQASLPVNVVLGQELSPRHSSTISSLLMGAAWGVGALLIGPIGAIADAHGLEWALRCLACLLVLGLACALALPDPARASAAAADLGSPLVAAE